MCNISILYFINTIILEVKQKEISNLGFNLPIHLSSVKIESLEEIKQDVFTFIKTNHKDFIKPWACSTLSNIKNSKINPFNNKLLNNIIKQHAVAYCKKLNINQNNLQLSELWINISPKDGFQEYHTHNAFGQSFILSGTLYIQSNNNSGDLMLKNPILNFTNIFPDCNVTPDIRIPPLEGTIVLFPSFLPHCVLPNLSSQKRISISWNIKLKN